MLSRRNILDRATVDPDKSWYESLLVVAKPSTAKLVLLAYAPAPDMAGGVEGECVVLSADYLDEFFEAWNQDRVFLYFYKISVEEAELRLAPRVLITSCQVFD